MATKERTTQAQKTFMKIQNTNKNTNTNTIINTITNTNKNTNKDKGKYKDKDKQSWSAEQEIYNLPQVFFRNTIRNTNTNTSGWVG